jgi:magnesium transporter
VPYPGYGTTAGVIASVLIIVVLATVLYIVFKRKEWL